MKELDPKNVTLIPGGTDAQSPTTPESTPPSLPATCVLDLDPLPPTMPVKHVAV